MSRAADSEPRGLAVETSAPLGSVALLLGRCVLAEEFFPHGLQHAAGLLVLIDQLCRRQGWGPEDLQRLYVSHGPGSFTGLRIGITLIKTLAWSTGAQIVAVPTLRALVENAPEPARHVMALLDAKRGQIYTARFERDDVGQWLQRTAAHLSTPAAALAPAPRPVYLIGQGIAYHDQALEPHDPAVIRCDPCTWQPRAAAVGRLGAQLAAAGEFTQPQNLLPCYIRKPEAEEKWEALQQTKAHANDASGR